MRYFRRAFGYIQKRSSFNHLNGVFVKPEELGIRLRGVSQAVDVGQLVGKVGSLVSSGANLSNIIATWILFKFVFQRVNFPASKASVMKKLNKVEGFGKPPKYMRNRDTLEYKRSVEALLEIAAYPLSQEGDKEITAGPFKIKDPLHLPKEKVAEIEKVVLSVVKHATNDVIPDFTKVLYGDIVLAEPVKTRVLANYNLVSDVITFFNHARLSNPKDYLKTILHELGHRYYKAVLSQEKKREWRVWHTIAVHSGGTGAAKFEDYKTEMAKVGVYVSFTRERFVSSLSFDGRGKPFYLMDTKAAERLVPGSTIRLSPEEAAGAYGIIAKNIIGDLVFRPIGETTLNSLTASAIRLGLIKGSLSGQLLPTAYAATNEEEHFCEALSYRAVGELKGKMGEEFERIFFGYSKPITPITETVAPQVPVAPDSQTEVSVAVGSKTEMDKKGKKLAEGLGLTYVSGRKYGTFVYTNTEALSTHAYMFLDYASGNLFVPKTKSFPNLDVNIANILDKDVEEATSFSRMSKLRPKWRTQAAIEEGISQPATPATPPQVSDQSVDPDVPHSPEQVSIDVVTASNNAAKLLGMSSEVLRKYVRIRYMNESGGLHAYLFVAKSDGAIYTPKAGHQASSEMVGNIFEPNIITKIQPTSLYKNDKWKTKFAIVGEK